MALQPYMPALQGSLGIRRPRNKYRNVAESYLSYCKKRKRRASRTRMLKRRMIKLLEKLLSQRDGIHSEYGALLRYTQDYQKRLSIIRKVLVQEKEMFEGRKVSDRIVNIDRHYVRPIVRGKETKSVEFGAKVNNIQIDGISFIEHLSFKAFNEGIRLKDCIRMQQKLMNVRVRYVAADSIYANNVNRKFDAEEPQYYTVAEAMEKFNLTRDQLYHYAKYHNIPKVKKGKYTFISKPELDKLLAAPKIE